MSSKKNTRDSVKEEGIMRDGVDSRKPKKKNKNSSCGRKNTTTTNAAKIKAEAAAHSLVHLKSIQELSENLKRANSQRPFASIQPSQSSKMQMDLTGADLGNWGDDDNDSSAASCSITPRFHRPNQAELGSLSRITIPIQSDIDADWDAVSGDNNGINRWSEKEEELQDWEDSLKGQIKSKQVQGLPSLEVEKPQNDLFQWQEQVQEDDHDDLGNLEDEVRTQGQPFYVVHPAITVTKDALKKETSVKMNTISLSSYLSNTAPLKPVIANQSAPQGANGMHFDEQSGAWEGGDVDMSGFESDQKDVPSSRTTSTYPDVETLQRPLHCKSSTSSVIRTDPEANYKKAPTIEPEEKPPLRTGSLKNMVNSRVRASSLPDFAITDEMCLGFEKSEIDHMCLMNSWQRDNKQVSSGHVDNFFLRSSNISDVEVQRRCIVDQLCEISLQRIVADAKRLEFLEEYYAKQNR